MAIHHRMLGNAPTDTERTFITLADDKVGTRSCSVYENILNPAAVVPWHSHPIEEVIVCLSGRGECTFNGSPPEQYQAGSVIVIPPNTQHTLRNIGQDLLVQLAVIGAVAPGTRWVGPEGSVGKSAHAG
jgi:quercetin dioxygenase-like cupin family protein